MNQDQYDDHYDPEGPGPEDEDLLDDEYTDTRTCPECGAEVYEGAGLCEKCGHCLVKSPWEAPLRRGYGRWHVVVGALLLSVLLIWWLIEYDVLGIFGG